MKTGALVYDNGGYKTRGHGYFIEDGWEKYNNLTHNLGMVAHQGVVLPTDQGSTEWISIFSNPILDPI